MIDDRQEAKIPAVTLCGRDVIGLYVHLSAQESGLAPDMVVILDRIEKELFRCLTIEQIEHIESLYSGVDRSRDAGAAEKEKRP